MCRKRGLFVASLMLSLNTGYSVQAPAQPVSQANNTADDGENDDYSDIDLDFIGGSFTNTQKHISGYMISGAERYMQIFTQK